jgi:hydroxymethylbilane synthase
VEIRRGNDLVREIVRRIDDPLSRASVEGERAFAERMGFGCNLPVAAHGEVSGGKLTLEGLVATTDGKRIVRASVSGAVSAPQKTGYSLADKMLALDATSIVGGPP